jgi:CDP-glucose 4,6-dehydratase
MSNPNFWKNKKVFLTGHTGFKGSWTSLWLSYLGADVKGYSLQPPTNPNLFEVACVNEVIESDINDIRDFESLRNSIVEFSPDIIFHMAAQPLVRASYKFPLETYETNIMGTANLLHASLEADTCRAIINITTDKCYENKEIDIAYKETDPMGGYDPYSSSKGCAELVSSAYRESFFNAKKIGLATVRAGNVIGGGDWAEDRLIPDILRAFEHEKSVIIRNPNATRPWQHVLEPISGYILLAENLYTDSKAFSESWNFGPNLDDVKPVSWILEQMTKLWPGSKWQLDESVNPHEAQLLKLDISKVKEKLNWSPVWNLETSLKKIVQWHKVCASETVDMQKYCITDIEQYIKDSNNDNH